MLLCILARARVDDGLFCFFFSIQTAAASTINAMRKNPKTNVHPGTKHIRKGGAGGWRDVYTVRESEAFDEIYLKEMEGTGLKMDFGEELVMP